MPVMILHAILHILLLFQIIIIFLTGPTIKSYIWQLNGSPPYSRTLKKIDYFIIKLIFRVQKNWNEHLTFTGLCSVIYSYNKTNEMH